MCYGNNYDLTFTNTIGGFTPSSALVGTVEYRNLAFSYPTRPHFPVFTDLNLSVPSGSSLAVVGPSGSG